MPTAITKSIGSIARDFATPQLFEDAIPSDITATDESWTGECFNDSEFTSQVIFSGITTDATRFIKLTTGAGQSFSDHANAATNAQQYDQSKGVGINSAASYTGLLFVSTEFTTIEKLQLKSNSGTGDKTFENDAANVIFGNLIVHHLDSSSLAGLIFQATSKIINSLIITEATTANGLALSSGGQSLNCTVVSPNDITNTGTGIGAIYSNSIVRNTSVFGFASAFSASGWDTTNSKNNATDGASAPGTANQISKTYANQFEDITSAGGLDYRVKVGSDMEDNGVRDQTETSDLDIIGQARSVTTPTIGHWEFITSGSPISQSFQFGIEALARIASTYSINIESTQASISQTTKHNVESLTSIVISSSMNIESLVRVQQVFQQHIETLISVIENNTIRVECVLGIRIASIDNIEITQTIQRTSSVNIENLGSVAITKLTVIAVEAHGFILANYLHNIESAIGVMQTMQHQDESLHVVDVSLELQIEQFSYIQVNALGLIEAVANVTINTPINIDTVKMISVDMELNSETLKFISHSTGIGIDAIQGAVVNTVIDVISRTAYFTLSINKDLQITPTLNKNITLH